MVTRLRKKVRAQPLPRRLGWAMAALVLVFSGLFVLFATSALRAAEQQDYVTQPVFEAVQLAGTRFEAVLDQETGLRGYLLAGTPEQLEPYERGIGTEAAAAARIREVIGGETGLVALSERVDELAAQWRSTYAEPLIADVRARGPRILDPVEATEGKRLFDEVRAADAAYLAALSEERQAALAAQDDAEQWVVAALAGGLMVGVLAAVGLAVALRRWVVWPVETLASEVRQVRLGDLDHQVRLHGPPELTSLARDVDLMRLSLVEQIARLEGATAAIERARVALEAQALELERSNRDLEQFAYVASHDLQEPLRKVASFCQLLERRYAGELDERADQYIAFAVDGAKRMQALINDLLAFSRVGRMSTPRTDVDLEQSLALALRNLAARIEETGAVVTHDPLPVVHGEQPLLVLLLQNLVSNAVKFHGAGVPRVHLSARSDGDGWELACSDDGIGIQPQYAERIFVIFQRLHGRDEYAGTGIGLAMCKKIVEYHGGRIWLDAAAGGIDGGSGTTIRWTLPAERPAVPAGVETELAEPPELTNMPVQQGGPGLERQRETVG